MTEIFILDPKTIFLVYFWVNLFICFLIFSYSLSYSNDDNRKILKRFGRGKLLITIGWLLIFLRDIIPDFISINIANTMIIYAGYYESLAVLSVLRPEAKINYRGQIFLLVLCVLIFNLSVFAGAPINSRVLIMCISIISMYIIPIIKYFSEKENNFFGIFCFMSYSFFGVLLVLKLFYNYFYPQQHLFSSSIFHGFYNIGLLLLAIVGTVGFMLLVKERQDSKIRKLLDDKNQFFTILAHDLRGSLGGSMLLSEILTSDMSKFYNEEIKEIALMLHQSNTSVNRMLENLLKWSKVQRGLIRFSPEDVILNNLISENLDFVKNAASIKNIKIFFVADETFIVTADRNMCDTILRNLLANAVKFTGRGGEITVKIQREAKKVIVSISDNGIGIPFHIKENLFNLSSDVIQRGTENEYGSGLGLILCREFIKFHKGEIWVESQIGVGSTFSFSFF